MNTSNIEDKIFEVLKYYNPLNLKDESCYILPVYSIAQILPGCYNETDVQFKLYDLISGYFDEFDLPERKSFYPIAKDIWKIKEGEFS